LMVLVIRGNRTGGVDVSVSSRFKLSVCSAFKLVATFKQNAP